MDLAAHIDHTNLKPTATREDITRLCQEARRHRFAAVCVQPVQVAHAARLLTGTDVLVAAVIGFPLGANTADVKAFEAERAVADGAGELDMVMNLGAMKEGHHQQVREDMAAVVRAARTAPVKVILETGYLDREEIVSACRLAGDAGAAFVKTSTGMGPCGATVEVVQLMCRSVAPGLQVKAAGGIRDRETALTLVEAGATRLGTSAGVNLVAGGWE